MRNNFLADYEKETENLKNYRAAKEAGDEAGILAARKAHNDLAAEIDDKGKFYSFIFTEFQESMDCENQYLDLNRVIWDRDIPELVACMYENGIKSFTFSSTWSGSVETAWLFQQSGCRLGGLVEINGRHKDFMSDEYEKVHAFLFNL